MSRLVAIPTTTVSIFDDVMDAWDGPTLNGTPSASAVPASIIEQPPRTVREPATGNALIVRSIVGRLPDGTPVKTTSRIVDADGNTYAITAMRQPRNPVWTGDIILTLVRNDQGSL